MKPVTRCFYRELVERAVEHGHRLGPGSSYELYRNTPGMVPKEELRTELYLPIVEQ